MEARGYCVKHYYRWQQHGDPLVFVKPGKKVRDRTVIRTRAVGILVEHGFSERDLAVAFDVTSQAIEYYVKCAKQDPAG